MILGRVPGVLHTDLAQGHQLCALTYLTIMKAPGSLPFALDFSIWESTYKKNEELLGDKCETTAVALEELGK